MFQLIQIAVLEFHKGIFGSTILNLSNLHKIEGRFLERLREPEGWIAESEKAEQGAKFSTLREIREFLSDCEVPRGGGDIPTPL